MKPIKVSAGEFIVDSNLKPIIFTLNQAKSFAKKECAEMSKRIGYKLKLSGVKELEEYFTYTIM